MFALFQSFLSVFSLFVRPLSLYPTPFVSQCQHLPNPSPTLPSPLQSVISKTLIYIVERCVNSRLILTFIVVFTQLLILHYTVSPLYCIILTMIVWGSCWRTIYFN